MHVYRKRRDDDDVCVWSCRDREALWTQEISGMKMETLLVACHALG